MLARHLVVALALLLGLAGPLAAQNVTDPSTGARTITSTTSGDIILGPLGGRGSGSVQLTGTWTGTFPIQGSSDQNCSTATYATIPGTTDLTSNGLTLFTAASIRCIKVPASGWSSGTVGIRITASSAGGGTSNGGGAGDASESTLLLIESAVDGLETLLGTTNTSLAIIDNMVFGAGTEAAALRVTLPTDGTGVVGVTGAALTALQLIDNPVGTVAAGTAATASFLGGLVYNSTPITLTNTQGAALQGDSNGYLKVNVAAGSAAGPSDTDDASIAAGQTVGLNAALGQMYNGAAWVRMTGDATNGLDVDVTRLSALVAGDADIGNVDLELAGTAVGATNPVAFRPSNGSAFVDFTVDPEDEDAFTTGTTKVVPSGFLAESTTDAIADGQIGAPAMTLVRSIRNTPTGYSTGGGTPSPYISVGSTEDEHAVCTGACTIYGLIVTNTNAAARYLKCENDTAANTAPGTDTPEFRIALQGTGGAAFAIPIGATFTTALTCWLVTGAADSDVAEVAANEIMVNYIKSE